MFKSAEPLFSLGRVLVTPGALEALASAEQSPAKLLSRHVHGDWGDLSERDRELNDEAVATGDQLLSAYTLNDGRRIWVVTDANEPGGRGSTTLLLPEEY